MGIHGIPKIVQVKVKFLKNWGKDISLDYSHKPTQEALRSEIKTIPKIITVSERPLREEIIEKYAKAVEERAVLDRGMPNWSLSMRFALDILPVLSKKGTTQAVLEALPVETTPQNVANFYEKSNQSNKMRSSTIRKALLSTGDPLGVSLMLLISLQEKLELSGVYEDSEDEENIASMIAENILRVTRRLIEEGPQAPIVIYGTDSFLSPEGRMSKLEELRKMAGEDEVLNINLGWHTKNDREIVRRIDGYQINLELTKDSFFSEPQVEVVSG